MDISIPNLSLVVLIGAAGSGKSTFAAAHFRPTEVLASDVCRALVSDDPDSREATEDAFEVLQFIASKRLSAGRLAVVDATNVQAEARAKLVTLARRHHVLPVAIVLDLPERLCIERSRDRAERPVRESAVRAQVAQLHRSVRNLKLEGFRHIFTLSTPEEVAAARLVRQPMWTHRHEERGPFDLIGDVHGCGDELRTLLADLGYVFHEEGGEVWVEHPEGRKVVWVGDLVDRGPDVAGVLRLAMGTVGRGHGLCVNGNHEYKLLRALRGEKIKLAHGLAESLAQLGAEDAAFRARVIGFLDGLLSHYVLDGGRLVATHAGLPASMQGRASPQVREFAMYGETTGEVDEYGLPVRAKWATDYRGSALVVHGHTPVPEAEWLNNTVCIDTGCVFGGKLTALRYPERELLSVPAQREYYAPVRPLGVATPALSAQQADDDVLDLADVAGKRRIVTALAGGVTVSAEHSAAALEAMSRYAADPRWLIYLPPTMSPSETSQDAGFLEHPREALEYYRRQGVAEVVCEQKHMGSRCIVIVCRDATVARRRFGVVEPAGGSAETLGICYTRTGRRFFADAALEQGLLRRLRDAAEGAGLWQELATEWLALDCELLPWSAKAQDLLRSQYAAVGSAALTSLGEADALLAQATARGVELEGLPQRTATRRALAEQYVAAYRGYCWRVDGLDDLRLAPFHLLASEGRVHGDKDHLWHLQTLARLSTDPLCLATPHLHVALDDEAGTAAAVAWWLELTARGGEGMVVKPRDFIARGRRGGQLIQPAVKCRGREYLRIIYGPEYSTEENLARLRERHLATKRQLALREFALGLEALSRFVAREPLRRVHECVFGVLALESEPVDPRL